MAVAPKPPQTRSMWVRLLPILLAAPVLGYANAEPGTRATVQELTESERVLLEERVNKFWEAWKAKDFDKAAGYLEETHRKRFRTVRKFPIGEWTIQEITQDAADRPEVQVIVTVERYDPLMGRYFNWRHISRWIRSSEGWVMRFHEPGR